VAQGYLVLCSKFGFSHMYFPAHAHSRHKRGIAHMYIVYWKILDHLGPTFGRCTHRMIFFFGTKYFYYLIIAMPRLAGNKNQKWHRGTGFCVVNLDLGTFGPHPLGS
jgi:hypothetical protein